MAKITKETITDHKKIFDYVSSSNLFWKQILLYREFCTGKIDTDYLFRHRKK